MQNWPECIALSAMILALGGWSGGSAEDVWEMEELVVTATRTVRPVWDVPASVEIIDLDTVSAATAIQLDELFKTVNGVDLQGSGFPGAQIKLNLRGLTPGYQSKRVLVLVDGRRVNDAFQGNAEFALLPAAGLARIEIVRGPGSALYGSSALGGVINIVTRRGATEPGRTLRLAAGEHGTLQARVDDGGSSGGTDWFVSLQGVDTDGYARNPDGRRRDWQARTLSANVGRRIGEAGALRAFFGGGHAEGLEENADRETDTDYQQVRYRAVWDAAREADFSAQVYRNAQRDVFDWIYSGRGIYRTETLAAELQQSLRLGRRHRVTAGAEARREAADVDDVSGSIDEHDTVTGAYAQDEITLAPGLHGTLGVRCDRNADYGTAWSPRAGLVAALGTGSELFASVSRAHRAPGLSDRYVDVEYDGRRFEGNPALRPETLTAYELGARRRVAGSVEVEVTGFYSALDDAFDFLLEPDGIYRIRNVTRSEVGGVEAALRWRARSWARLYLQGAWTDGTYDAYPADPSVAGNTLAYLAREKAGAGVDLILGRAGRHGLSARYVGKREGDAQNSAENRLDAYSVLDWRSRVPAGHGIALTLNIDNVLDADYADFPGQRQPGRFVMAGVEVVF
jgi:outer membrane cobalamin receptor